MEIIAVNRDGSEISVDGYNINQLDDETLMTTLDEAMQEYNKLI